MNFTNKLILHLLKENLIELIEYSDRVYTFKNTNIYIYASPKETKICPGDEFSFKKIEEIFDKLPIEIQTILMFNVDLL